eukprot:COSAG02_NODE_8264_length_2638_cov_1.376920_2_plen_628_part_00
MLKKGASIKMDHCTVKVVERLSEGGFAYVHRVKEDSSGKRHYALKQIVTNSDAELSRAAERERLLMQSLAPHPNIIGLLASASASGSVMLLLELCQGSLADRVLAKQSFGWSELLDAFGQITAAIVHLHSQTPPIAHRDLKIENVLVASDGLYKLCDFGSCSTEARVFENRADILAAEEQIGKTTTMMYRAPEMIDLYQGLLVNEQVDVWALGCVLYTMAFFAHPFSDGSATRILNGEGTTAPDMSTYPTALQLLLDRMFVRDPTQRATASQLLETVGQLRLSSDTAEAEAASRLDAVVVTPRGWLMKKGDGKKKKGLGAVFGSGSKWERVWCALESEAGRLSFFSEPDARQPLEAISMQSIVKAEQYTGGGKYPLGWSLIIKGSQKQHLLRPCDEKEAVDPVVGQEKTHAMWMAVLAQIEADNAATIARAAARHSFRDLAAGGGSPIVREAKGNKPGGKATMETSAAPGIMAANMETQENWDADFSFAENGDDPFAPASTSVEASADAFDADWGDCESAFDAPAPGGSDELQPEWSASFSFGSDFNGTDAVTKPTQEPEPELESEQPEPEQEVAPETLAAFEDKTAADVGISVDGKTGLTDDGEDDAQGGLSGELSKDHVGEITDM